MKNTILEELISELQKTDKKFAPLITNYEIRKTIGIKFEELTTLIENLKISNSDDIIWLKELLLQPISLLNETCSKLNIAPFSKKVVKMNIAGKFENVNQAIKEQEKLVQFNGYGPTTKHEFHFKIELIFAKYNVLYEQHIDYLELIKSGEIARYYK